MLFIKFIRFFLGYIKVTLWGKFPERFLNVCAQKGIKVWNTRRQGERIEFCIFARDYKRLPQLRRRCPVHLRAKAKYGLPFITKRYRRRKGLVVGFAIYAAVLVMLPKIVWGVNISGNRRISDDELHTALRTVGIHTGVRVSDIDAANMRLRLALLLPDISWAAVNLDGAFVNVEIREAEPKQSADTAPCNLVADFDGRVTAVFVRQGTATVKVGDGVRKGDMLASGTEEYSSGITKFRHSDGEIIAEVERSLTVKIPLNQTKTTYTGRVQSRQVLTLFDYDIPLYIGDVNFDYKLKSTTSPIRIYDTTLPFTLTKGEFYEKVQTKYRLSEKEAYGKALKALEDLEKAELKGFEIVNKEVNPQPNKDELVLTANYLCKGNIAKKEYIYVSQQAS